MKNINGLTKGTHHTCEYEYRGVGISKSCLNFYFCFCAPITIQLHRGITGKTLKEICNKIDNEIELGQKNPFFLLEETVAKAFLRLKDQKKCYCHGRHKREILIAEHTIKLPNSICLSCFKKLKSILKSDPTFSEDVKRQEMRNNELRNEEEDEVA